MTSKEELRRRIPTRKEPPPFRRVVVQAIDDRSPRLRRVVLGGPELEGFEVDEPAASVRLLLPPPGGEDLVMPEWSGNEFLLPDGDRATIRTFTPRFFDPEAPGLTIEIVVHDEGAASEWVSSATIGDEVAISGPGRGYEIDTDAASYLLAGDETAVPAVSQLLEELPQGIAVTVRIEVAEASAIVDLPAHPGSSVEWLDLPEGDPTGAALVQSIISLEEMPEAVWVAGEAAAVQQIRKHLFDVRGLSRSEATVRGYWKQGRSAT